MRRRRFLVLAGSALALAGIPGTALAFRIRSRTPLLVRTGLVDVMGDEEEVLRIGTVYRKAFPEEDDPGVLEGELLRSAGTAGFLPDRFLERALAHRVVREFERGETVEVDGWILSRTEARRSALLSLERR
jgi:hypothetical protein